MKRAALIAATVMAVVFAVTTVVCGFAAIWVDPPLQGKLGGTAALAGLLAFLTGLVTAAAWDPSSW